MKLSQLYEEHKQYKTQISKIIEVLQGPQDDSETIISIMKIVGIYDENEAG